jgi:peptidoglycan hydrolase-like protein with peptidoglycan-binding domain
MDNLRELIAKMDAIEAGNLEEAFNIKTVQNAVGNIGDEQQRAAALAKMAVDNNLPGLYDPIKGHFVSANGSISNTADKDTDYMLAQKGLMPKNANTSTFLGKIFGTSGDKYDTGLRGQSDKVVADQESEEFKRERLTALQTMMKDLMAMKPVPKAAKESIEFKGSISRNLVESFGYTTVKQEESQTDEGFGSVLARAAPGAGAVLGAQDAVDRWGKGDKVGAVLAGLSGAFSLVPGLGWIPALGFAAANMGRDYAKSKTDPAGSTPPAGGQSGSPSGNTDQKLQKLQKIIGAQPDGKMGPETRQKLQAWQQKQGIAADGIPGPETYGKAGIKESAVEQYRNLVARLEAIQEAGEPVPAEAPAAAEAKPDAPDQQEASLADMITKAGGQFVEFPPGHEKAGMQVLVVKKDVGPIVDPQSMEILDNATLAPTGQKFDPAAAGLSESQLDEGLWDSIVKGAMALGSGAKNLFRAPVAVGASKVGSDGAKYSWKGAQWVNDKTGRVASKQVAAGLGKGTGGAAGKALASAGKVIKNNPVKTGLATVAAGGALGALSGANAGGQSASPSGNGGNGGGGGGSTTPTEPEAPVCSPEMIAKIGEIRKVMGQLADYDDPAVQQVLQNYQEKIDGLKCGNGAETSGQSASPSAAPKSTWQGVQYT